MKLNMYGCTPCPKCNREFRYSKKDHMTYCDYCNFIEECNREDWCAWCHSEVDRSVCWCGEDEKQHGLGGAEHTFVPMGCNCMRDSLGKKMPSSL